MQIRQYKRVEHNIQYEWLKRMKRKNCVALALFLIRQL